jgi:hypothetical protein
MIYDIFYISDGSIDIEKWNNFKNRFPLARKIENVNSYNDIKSKSFTKFFWIVWDDLGQGLELIKLDTLIIMSTTAMQK